MNKRALKILLNKIGKDINDLDLNDLHNYLSNLDNKSISDSISRGELVFESLKSLTL